MISKSTFVGQYIADINQSYTFVKELASGSYGTVYRVQNKLTGEVRACKKLNKRKIKNKERFKTEIDLLKATDHKHIVKLYEIYEDNVYLYLIMEECLGGEFFERLSQRAQKKNLYTEKDAANIFKQMLSAINYCHSHGVSHRDLKPENILFSTPDEDAPLKLIDFGLSKVFTAQDHQMKSIVGTTYYMAPEVLKGEYDERCDVWSLGVILYIMLCGRPPFYGKTDEETAKKITSKSYNFNYPEWSKVSDQVKELITSIFVDTKHRPTSQEVLNHPWLTGLAPNSTDEVLNLDFNHLKEYAKLNKMQKTVISFVSFRLKDGETKALSDIFKAVDKNNDGVISLSELKDGLNLIKQKEHLKDKIQDSELDKVFNEIDLDKNGMINYNEFISATIDYKKMIKQEHLYEAFRSFDSDKSGKLSLKELCDVIKPETTEDLDYVKKLLKQYDKNGDGEIDWEEFLAGIDLYDDGSERR